MTCSEASITMPDPVFARGDQSLAILFRMQRMPPSR
jgi:hypothetical protein